jgi:hypothetical protein
MAILKDKDKDNIKSGIVNYLLHCNETVDTDVLVNKINSYLPFEERLKDPSMFTTSLNILVTTGAGNTIQGGADIWTNHFLKFIWPNLPKRKNWRLLIDSKRPTNFDENSLPEGLIFHFHGDDSNKTEKWLSECMGIYYLHSHYHKREYIWKWERKFKTIFVHAYPTEMEEVINKVPELKRLQFNTKVDSAFYNEFLQSFNKRIWIGNNPSKVLEDFPNYTYTIPNFYKFKHNIRPNDEINSKIGFASRAESRKCLHWVHGHPGFVLTGKYDFENLKESTGYSFPGVKFYQWNPTIHDKFMRKDFDIFHGAYFKEPFGYSIFQAVDYGKIPIIHTDWAKEVDYKYRASSKNEFDKMVKKIIGDDASVRFQEFFKLKTYMMTFDNVENWSAKILEKFI